MAPTTQARYFFFFFVTFICPRRQRVLASPGLSRRVTALSCGSRGDSAEVRERPPSDEPRSRRPEEEAVDSSARSPLPRSDSRLRISIQRAARRVQQKRAKRTAISEIKRPNAPATRRWLPRGLSGSPTANKPDTNIPRPALMRRPRQNQSLENTHSWRPWRSSALYVRVNKPTTRQKFLPTWPAAKSRRVRER